MRTARLGPAWLFDCPCHLPATRQGQAQRPHCLAMFVLLSEWIPCSSAPSGTEGSLPGGRDPADPVQTPGTRGPAPVPAPPVSVRLGALTPAEETPIAFSPEALEGLWSLEV